MTRHRWLLALCLLISFAAAQQPARGGREYPPTLSGAKVEVYKTIGDVKLNMYVFTPADHKSTDKRAAIVFFFGGGWQSGSPGQFHEHCKYLAGRGMVAMTADYRVASRHKVKAVDCVRDAKSAIRWTRQEAARLGIDPARIVAAGGSAGGHLAACTGVIRGLDERSEEAAISSQPSALALFNPALVLAPLDDGQPVVAERIETLRERMGVELKELSPYHHVAAGAPPTIIFHGKADSTVPYRTAEAFTAAMKKAGNRCELLGYDDQAHGFFNFGRGENVYYNKTLRELDDFLGTLGYVAERPTVKPLEPKARLPKRR